VRRDVTLDKCERNKRGLAGRSALF